MPQPISAMEARKKFGEVLNRVFLRHEEIIIERAGKQIAKLSPLDEQVDRPKGKLDFRKAAGLGREIWSGVDAEKYVQQERSEWE